MLNTPALTAILPTLPVQPFSRVLYRAVTRRALVGVPPYPQVRPLYALGASIRGGRFTPIGGMASLYLASDPETALAEVNQAYAELRRQTPPIMAHIPVNIVYSVETHLDAILDLSDPTIQTALQTSVTELTDPAWRYIQTTGIIPPTQRLGQAAFDYTHIQALLYPSAQLPDHACLVVFTERLAHPSYVEVDDPDGYLRERLP